MKRIMSNTHNAYRLYRSRHAWLPMMKDIFSGNYRPSVTTLLILAITLIYLISPVDLLPDFIPLLGWTDDGAAIYFLIRRFKKEHMRYIAHKAGTRQ